MPFVHTQDWYWSIELFVTIIFVFSSVSIDHRFSGSRRGRVFLGEGMQDDAEKEIEQFKIKKIIRRLESAKG